VKVSLRVAAKGDYADLERIEADVFRERSQWRYRWWASDYAEYLLGRGRLGVVAVMPRPLGAGRVVGGIVYRFEGDALLLDRIVVDPEFARRGVGRQLVAHLDVEAPAYTWTYAWALGLQLFLRASGFAWFRTAYTAEREEVYLMRRPAAECCGR